jgi:hypothetical protein
MKPTTPPALPRALGRGMKHPRLKWILLLVAISLLPLYVAARFAYWFGWGAHIQIEERQQLVLYKTDHELLLEACREVMTNVDVYVQNPEWHNLPPGSTGFPDPNDPRMPEILPGAVIVERLLL